MENLTAQEISRIETTKSARAWNEAGDKVKAGTGGSGLTGAESGTWRTPKGLCGRRRSGAGIAKSVNLVVGTDIDQDYFPFVDDQFQGDAVADIDGDGVQAG